MRVLLSLQTLWVIAAGCPTDDAVQLIDRSQGCETWYADADGDGFGDPGVGVVGCLEPTGHVFDDSDCDDADADTHPGAVESCDDADQDCDGMPDNDAIDAVQWMVDADGDNLGDDATAVWSCDAIPGTVRTGGDRDDDDPGRGAD